MREVTFALSLGMITFLLVVIWGGPFIILLKRFKIGKQIRVDGPQTHFTKMGTPTMGGLLFIIPILGINLMLNIANIIKPITGRSILLPMTVMAAYCLLGMLDDWEGLRGSRAKFGEGLSERYKFIFQTVLALGASLVLYFGLDAHSLALPGNPFKFDLGWFYIPIATFIILSTVNAVNFTDGLDGLAGLISATAFAAYGVIAVLQGQFFVARFCYVIVGALFAFLWYNVHPAQLFMGDTGSMALGGTLAVISLMTGQWLLLPMIAIIPVAVILSVVIQRGYYKWSGGKRIFKMAPLHHHFELVGWSETQIVQRFWLVGLLGAMVGVGLAML